MNDTEKVFIDYGLRTSEDCGGLYAALAKAQGVFGPIKRTRTNPYYHSKYADLADVIEATQAALSANGLCVIQGSGTDTGLRVCYITTRLAHASGQWVEQMVALPATMRAEQGKPERFDAQSVGAAITYGRRYGRSAILGVASEDDDDANAVVEPPREGDAQTDGRPAMQKCPRCGVAAIIKGDAKYGGGWVCWKKKGGCGAKWDDMAWQAMTSEGYSDEVQGELLDAQNAPIESPAEVAAAMAPDRKTLVAAIASTVLKAGDLITEVEREMYRTEIKAAKDTKALQDILDEVVKVSAQRKGRK